MNRIFQTITLGRIYGIPLKIHWTFLILIAYVIYQGYTEQRPEMLFLTLFLFVCVVLHEYGHALMARYYGIGTEDIILSPIGGVARLQRMPEEPKKEIAIAFAGPFVNLVIALIAFAYIKLSSSGSIIEPAVFEGKLNLDNAVRAAFLTNSVLFLFNLLPAFPMDGGRILRAGLAWKYGRAKSTFIASIIGKFIALCFIGYGLYVQDYVFAALGVFVLFSANTENREVNKNETLALKKVKDYINTRPTKLHIGDPMSRPIHLFKSTGEANFIAYDSLGYIAGTMPTYFILEAIKKQADQESVVNWLSKEILYISSNANLRDAYLMMNERGAGILLVNDENNNAIGVIDRNTIMRVLDYENINMR
jgi:Zn-dependent protease